MFSRFLEGKCKYSGTSKDSGYVYYLVPCFFDAFDILLLML